MQYKAMFKKRYYHFKRDKITLCCELFLPIFFVALPIYFAMYFPEEEGELPGILKLESMMYDTPQQFLMNA